jgi:hypothetical protein
VADDLSRNCSSSPSTHCHHQHSVDDESVREIFPRCIGSAAGHLLLVVSRLTPLKLAGQAVAEGSDVYLFLIGMTLLSELANEHSVLHWLSSVAFRRANGPCSRLFTLVYGIGKIVTIFMSNDAIAVVLTRAIPAAVRKAKVEPLPYLLVCALIASARFVRVVNLKPGKIWSPSTTACPLGAMADVLRCPVHSLNRIDPRDHARFLPQRAMRPNRLRSKS